MGVREDAFFSSIRREVEAGSNERCLIKALELRKRLFLQQLEFVNDPERHKSLLCPRRSGKSYALAVYILITMMERPGANIVFIARTRDKAKEILWDTAETSLKKLNKEFQLGLEFSEVHTAIRAPNGSRCRLRGCETLADIEQYRGEPFHLVVIDECASFSPGVLDHLLKRAIEPTLGDFLGSVVLSGTPGAVLAGPFYKATGDVAFNIENGTALSRPYADRDAVRWSNVDYSWSFHSWSRQDNKAIPHLWQEALRIQKLNAWTDQNPIWLREYIGRWIQDDANLVYKFHPERNIWIPGPRTPSNPFGLPKDFISPRYVAGMDFGSKDPFAFQLMAYSDHDPRLFHCAEKVLRVSDSEKVLTPPLFARAIRQYTEIVEIESMVGDFGPFGDMMQEQMLNEHGLWIEKAIKKDKRDHIELLNGDFIDDRCFLLPDSEAARQMLQLSWDDTGLKERVGGGIRNDACDGIVYTWRRVLHHYHEDLTTDPQPGTPQYELARQAAEVEGAVIREMRLRDPERYADRSMDGDAEEIQWP